MPFKTLKFLRIKKYVLLIALLGVSVNAWSLSDNQSKHLLLRAGFGAQVPWVATLSTLNKKQAVNYLLNLKSQTQAVPSCVLQALPTRAQRKQRTEKERRVQAKVQRQCATQLKAWYLQELIQGDGVLAHKMELLWHNHFTSSLKKVKSSQLIYRQHQTITTFALGDFTKLLAAMVNDPAMLIYLDNVNNTKAKPNENLGRELLELFTLGEGHYSEADVLSAAQALTGLGIDVNTYHSVLRRKRHDSSQKKIFSHTAIESPDDLVKALLSHPRTAVYITERVWLHFISEANDREISNLAAQFSKDWDIKKLVSAVLTSDYFWQDTGQMFKSPVELVVGSARLFKGLKIPSTRMAKMTKQMGQDIFDPPNVKGWPRGRDWIDESKLIVRTQLTDQLARAINSNMAVMGAPYCAKGALKLLSAIELPVMMQKKNNMKSSCQRQLTYLVTDPSWQLK